MKLLCKCEEPIYFQPVVSMIKPNTWKRQTAIYCDCGSVIEVNIKKYFSETDYRQYKKYSGREIQISPFSIDEFDVKLICGCSNVVVFSGTHLIDKNKIIRLLCSKCKSLYEISFSLFQNIKEYENSKKVKIYLGSKPSIDFIDKFSGKSLDIKF